VRKWGILISVFYALIVVGLLLPGMIFLFGGDYSKSVSEFKDGVGDAFGSWIVWIVIAILLSGQALLLFLSVDTSRKRLKPRAHIATSVIVTSALLALLALAMIFSIGVGVGRDKFMDTYFDTLGNVIICWLALWLIWGIVFYWYARNTSAVVSHAVDWLLTGSVLELLIAVPCHVIVRRRNDCSAPIITSFGIVTGIAVMLLSFGPSVLVLYKKRLDSYNKPDNSV
jgi:hypothetical protein